eukprot:746094-Hanusia_phi.AAC.1
MKDLRILRYAPTPEEIRLVVTGNLRLAFRAMIPITRYKSILAQVSLECFALRATATTREHHSNKGSVAAPLTATEWDDGTILPDTINHADACSSARAPNE